jgi:hypothetical protein
VVAQDHHVLVAQVCDEAFALGLVDRRPLERVIRDAVMEAQRPLRRGHQAALHRRDRHARARVRVQHAGNVVPRGMDRAVDHVAGLVHSYGVPGLVDHVARQVDLVEARRRDLLVQVAEGLMRMCPASPGTRTVMWL